VEPPSFTVPGSYTWTVPPGVTTIQVVAAGGGGGTSSSSSGNGGVVVRAMLSVSPIDVQIAGIAVAQSARRPSLETFALTAPGAERALKQRNLHDHIGLIPARTQ
jgi:hypothetical protein